eukprot:jgi/Galph1/2621/GphlegSOOS_G1309.1
MVHQQKKRKRYTHTKNQPPQNKSSCLGCRGVLVTCSPRQQAACSKEAYQILLEYAEIINDRKKIENLNEESNCVEQVSLESELEQLRGYGTNTNQTTDISLLHTFSQVQVGVKGSIFFAIVENSTIDPCELVYNIMNDIQETQTRRCRYSVRFIPVDGVCYAKYEQVSRAVESIFAKRFYPIREEQPNTFAVVFRKRNNTDAHREDFIRAVADKVPSAYRVDLKNPQYSILIEVLKTACFISVVQHYNEYYKFNVHELAERTVSSQHVQVTSSEG